MTGVLAVVLGAAIGISLGALGGGGSVLTVPALVYVLAVLLVLIAGYVAAQSLLGST